MWREVKTVGEGLSLGQTVGRGSGEQDRRRSGGARSTGGGAEGLVCTRQEETAQPETSLGQVAPASLE